MNPLKISEPPLTAEQTAILLETLSFFLVTLDLFGRDRLEKLHNQLNALLKKLRNLDVKGQTWRFFTPDLKVKDSDFTYGCVGAAIFLASLAIGTYVAQRQGGYLGWILLLPVALLITIFGTAAIMQSIYWALVGVEKVADAVFDLILRMFTMARLDGVMLLTGSILFVISKAISFVRQ